MGSLNRPSERIPAQRDPTQKRAETDIGARESSPLLKSALELAMEHEAQAPGLVHRLHGSALEQAPEVDSDAGRVVGKGPDGLGRVGARRKDGDGQGLLMGVDANEQRDGRIRHGSASWMKFHELMSHTTCTTTRWSARCGSVRSNDLATHECAGRPGLHSV